jgi:hypothetical protein
MVDPGVEYVGADVVLELIEQNKKLYLSKFLMPMLQKTTYQTLACPCAALLDTSSESPRWHPAMEPKEHRVKYFLSTLFPAITNNVDISPGSVPPIKNSNRSTYQYPCYLHDSKSTDESSLLAVWRHDLIG